MPLTPQDGSRLQELADRSYARPAVALIAAAAAGFLLQKLMRSARRTTKRK